MKTDAIKKFFRGESPYMYLLILATAVGITVTGIVYDQDFFRMIPLYVSLSVMLFQSKALVIAPLIGGINSIIYAFVDYSYGLYASMLSDILISFPFQIATFILWFRKKDGATTRFRNLSNKWRIITLAAVVAAYIPCLIFDIISGATLAPLDAYTLVSGFLVSTLMLLAFVEYTYASVFGCVITVIMNSIMVVNTPDRSCYLIFSIYSLICCTRGLVNVRKIYARQRMEIKE